MAKKEVIKETLYTEGPWKISNRYDSWTIQDTGDSFSHLLLLEPENVDSLIAVLTEWRDDING